MKKVRTKIVQFGKAEPSTCAEIAQGDSGNLGKCGHEQRTKTNAVK